MILQAASLILSANNNYLKKYLRLGIRKKIKTELLFIL
jgi:hypothetical protein